MASGTLGNESMFAWVLNFHFIMEKPCPQPPAIARWTGGLVFNSGIFSRNVAQILYLKGKNRFINAMKLTSDWWVSNPIRKGFLLTKGSMSFRVETRCVHSRSPTICNHPGYSLPCRPRLYKQSFLLVVSQLFSLQPRHLPDVLDILGCLYFSAYQRGLGMFFCCICCSTLFSCPIKTGRQVLVNLTNINV